MTHFDKSCWVGLVTAALAVSAGLLLAVEAWDLTSSPQESASEEFQRTVGGLGCGPAVDLSRCAFSFDPRLCDDCPLNHEPVPGAVYFCPQHACSILYCRPLVPAAEPFTQEKNDGRSP